MDILAAQQMQTKPVLPGMTVLPAGTAGAGGDMFQSLLGQLLGTEQAGMPVALPGQPALLTGTAVMPTLPGTAGVEGDGAILPAGMLLPTGPVTIGITGGTGPLPAVAPMALIPLRTQPLASMGGLGATGTGETGLVLDGAPLSGELLPALAAPNPEGKPAGPGIGGSDDGKGAILEVPPQHPAEGQIPVAQSTLSVEPPPAQTIPSDLVAQPLAPPKGSADAPAAGAADPTGSPDATTVSPAIPSAMPNGAALAAPAVQGAPAPAAAAQTAMPPAGRAAASAKAGDKGQASPQAPATPVDAVSTQVSASASQAVSPLAAPAGEIAGAAAGDATPAPSAGTKAPSSTRSDSAQAQQAAAAQAAAQAAQATAQATAQAPAAASPVEPQAQAAPTTDSTGRTRPSDRGPAATATDGAAVEGEETAKGTLPVEEDSGTRAAEQRDWRSRERETRGSGDNARAEEAANQAAAAAAPRPQAPTPPTAPTVAADPRIAGLAGIGGSAGSDTPSGGNSGQNGGDSAARGSETDPAAAFSPTPDTQRTQGPDFAQHLAAARTMRHGPQAAPQQIAVHVQRAVADGQDRLTLQLRPAELGRIDVQLEFSKDGTLKAKVLVENPATLDMLKSDARNLERALHDAGLKTDANGLNFSLRDQGGEAQRDRDQPKGRDVNLRVADSAGADPAALPQVAGPILGPGRVDVRI